MSKTVPADAPVIAPASIVKIVISKQDRKKIKSCVDKAFQALRKERDAREYDRLRVFLAEKRDKVLEELHQQHPAKTVILPLLKSTDEAVTSSSGTQLGPFPSSDNTKNDRVKSAANTDMNSFAVSDDEGPSPTTSTSKLTQRRRVRPFEIQRAGQEKKIKTSTITIERIRLVGTEPVLPTHITYIPIQKNYEVEDSKLLTYVPYIGDNDLEEEIFSLHDTEYRENLVNNGSEIAQQETNRYVDDLLRECIEALNLDINDSSQETNAHLDILLTLTASAFEQPLDRVKSRYGEIVRRSLGMASPIKKATSSVAIAAVNDDGKVEGSNDEKIDDETRYVKEADSYRKLFCRRCFVYDCNPHGLMEKPSLKFQLEQGLRRESEGYWQSSPKLGAESEPVDSGADRDGTFREVKQLSKFQQTIAKRLFSIFDGDVHKMSIVLRAPKELIEDFARENEFVIPERAVAKVGSNRKADLPYYSVKNYKASWYRAYETAEIYGMFLPCSHDEPCDDSTCSCVMNRFFCTHACSWGPDSPNFFRGCCCAGSCSTSQCICLAAKRECDPDICGCDTCSDPPCKPVKSQRCRNDSILMQRRAHIVIAKSNVAGWGAFTKYPLKRGTYVCEYIGETISQEEAERRGRIGDAQNRSYLFNLSADNVIDASRKANKARFLNHSDTANCETKTMFVKGEQRIGIFTTQDVDAQCELFFDYRYSVAINNELFDKPAKTFPWMKPAKKPERSQIASETAASRGADKGV